MINKLFVRTVAAGMLAAGAVVATAGTAQALPRDSSYCQRLLDTARDHLDLGNGFLALGNLLYAGGYYSLASQNYEYASANFDLADAASTAYSLDCT